MSENRMGEFLAALRKTKGYTQQEIAERLGVSNKTVSSWETGASAPDISMLPVLAELYEVTCDEIIRGKRIPAADIPNKNQPKRDKAIRRILQKQQTNLATVCWISGGLTVLSILVTMLTGFAALESLLAFFIGLIFLIASFVTAAIALRRIRFALGSDWINGETDKLNASIDKAFLGIICANTGAFAFILPHATAPVHTGLSTDWLLPEFACGLLGLFLALLVGIPVLLHRRKKILQIPLAEGASLSAADPRQKAIALNKLAQWRYKHIVLIIVLPLFLFAIAAACLGAVNSSLQYHVSLGGSQTLDCTAESLNAVQGPFQECEYTLVSEEQPQSPTETGKYEVKFLFPEFPEHWRKYYRTEDTDEGTLVTIWKYRVKIYDSEEILEFYAYQEEYQGGISVLSATKYGDARYLITLEVAPTLYDEYMQLQTANLKDTLSLCTLGVAALGVLSLAVSVPVFLRKNRNFRRSFPQV